MGRVEEGRGVLRALPIAPFPIPAHQTGRADFPHPAFRLVSSQTHERASVPGAGTPPTPRGSVASKNLGCLAWTPCRAFSENASHVPPHVHRALRKPWSGSRSRSTLSSLAVSGSADPALLPKAPHCWAGDALPLSL